MSALFSAVQDDHEPDGVRALRPPIRTGDVVKHLPSGETWLVAWADQYEVICCGWPESMARITDCELVIVCSDEEHWDLVRKIADSCRDSAYDTAVWRCSKHLDRRYAAECAAMMHL